MTVLSGCNPKLGLQALPTHAANCLVPEQMLLQSQPRATGSSDVDGLHVDRRVVAVAIPTSGYRLFRLYARGKEKGMWSEFQSQPRATGSSDGALSIMLVYIELP